jgi:DNA/RNA-binding domain of Phe-tRNA-synthetase-like protein
MTTWIVDGELRAAGPCFLGRIEWSDVVVVERSMLWSDRLADAASSLRSRFVEPASLIADKRICATRDAYVALGASWKRTPPATEALVQRVLAGKPFPTINSMVDFNSLLAATTLLPVGSYDASQIDGAVRFVKGEADHHYAPIGGSNFSCTKLPTLIDRVGPFGSATRDSLRTMIRPTTTRATTVVMSFVEPDQRLFEEVEAAISLAREMGVAANATLSWI